MSGIGVSPKTALAVGLKVDVDAFPATLVSALKEGKVNLDDPGVTLELLRRNAGLGVTGFFGSPHGGMRSVGLQCSLCLPVTSLRFTEPGWNMHSPREIGIDDFQTLL